MNLARGLDQSQALKRDPDIAEALSIYRECRSFMLFETESVRGSGKQQMVSKKIVPFPTGYGVLPYEGGIMDQPHKLMIYFDIFLNAERKAVFDNLKK